MMTGPVVPLIYWCGLGLIALSGYGIVGAAVGVAIRSGSQTILNYILGPLIRISQEALRE